MPLRSALCDWRSRWPRAPGRTSSPTLATRTLRPLPDGTPPPSPPHPLATADSQQTLISSLRPIPNTARRTDGSENRTDTLHPTYVPHPTCVADFCVLCAPPPRGYLMLVAPAVSRQTPAAMFGQSVGLRRFQCIRTAINRNFSLMLHFPQNERQRLARDVSLPCSTTSRYRSATVGAY